MSTPDLGTRRRDFRGDVIGPEDAGFDPARRIYNGAIDGRPALVACCADPDDVATAIALARELDHPLAVRAGDHGVAGHAICEGGVVVDLPHGLVTRRALSGRPALPASRSAAGSVTCWDRSALPATALVGEEPASRLRTAFGEAKFERLRALKRQYNPQNVCRLNQNIPPD